MAAQEGAMVKRFHSRPRGAERRLLRRCWPSAASPASPTCWKRPTAATSARYSDKPNAARLTDGLGTDWETLKVGYKPHASVTSIHTALDGLADIMREHELKADDIAKVEVGVEPHDPCALRLGIQGAGRDRGADESVLTAWR